MGSYPMCWSAFLTIGGKKAVDDNYTYFTQLFLMAVVYSFAVGYFSCILVEKPFQSLVKAIPYEGPSDLGEQRPPLSCRRTIGQITLRADREGIVVDEGTTHH